jgi:hypothetical protein
MGHAGIAPQRTALTLLRRRVPRQNRIYQLSVRQTCLYLALICGGDNARTEEALRSFQNSERILTQHHHDFVRLISSYCSVPSQVIRLAHILGYWATLQLSLCYKSWSVLSN